MTPKEKQLWYKLESFKLDEQEAKLTFSTRLARENGWSKNYALRVIEEYKKFLFMCCTSPTAVTPSDPVDQAWHLHLTYTKSYWTDLCKNTLNKEIHHNPTKGGESEQQKFNSLYIGMQELYKEKFGTVPPPDIWHDNKTRFSDINFQRVNLSHYWMIKKPKINLPKLIIPMLVIMLSGFLIQASFSNVFIGLFIIFIIIATIKHFKNDNNNNGNSGSGYSGDSNSVSCSGGDSHSGCSSHNHSSDSGCSSSGCSGCGSGCGGD